MFDSPTLTDEDRALQDLLGAPSTVPVDFSPPPPSLPLENTPLQSDLDNPRAVLQHYWGHSDFRGIQAQIVESILAGCDTIGLMPTGGGKSVTFQVPGLMLEGVCLVVTPLIALMKDQVEQLRRRGIRAAAIHSGLSREEIGQTLDNVILGNYKFLYLSPERLSTDTFLLKLPYMRVSFVTIDEAHCISQWGHDFRPAYLTLSHLRLELAALGQHVPFLALTATATQRVLQDIREQLWEADSPVKLFRMSFERPNIAYLVQHSENKTNDLVDLLHHYSGSAIVYTRSRAGTRDVAITLTQMGFSAFYYHAGLSTTDKSLRQEAWQRGDVRVMVATNAFGMGIDKSDVRLVVHLDLPDSIEAYFQEAGRAGRDGKAASAILLFNGRDQKLLAQRIRQTYPEKEVVRSVYEDLASYFQIGVGDGEGAVLEFNLDDFCRTFRYFPIVVVNSLAILARGGYLAYQSEEETTSRVMMLMKRDELYQYRTAYPIVEKVLEALLRQYTGLFSEYVFIEEERLAQSCQLTPDEVYQTLITLNRARVLHYVPRKSVAKITYLMRRIETSRLGLPPVVYEERRDDYEHRIHAMLDYCIESNTCRSVQLLRYFDDDSAQACGHCDVCQEHATALHSSSSLETHLREVLSDGRPHAAVDFCTASFDLPQAQAVLSHLIERGEVEMQRGFFTLKTRE